MDNKRVLTKRELRNELFGILAMCDAFLDECSMVGGKRKKEMVNYLPKQITSKIMVLQDMIETSNLSN